VFRAPAGPLQEQLISYASVGLISLGVLIGFRPAWRRYRRNALALTMAVASLGYLASIVFRVISSQGAELTGRSWSFTFVVVGFVLAVAVVEIRKKRPERWMRFALPAVCILIFLGGIVSGMPPYWGRLPGPYLVSGDERSVEPQGVMAAYWAREELGPFNRMATDFTDHILMGSYGEQAPDTALSTVFFSPQFGPDDQQWLRDYAIRYMVVDQRLSTALPAKGYYFNRHEPDAYEHKQPIAAESLAKFNSLAEVGRIYDSGDIVIYDVRELSGAR